MASISKTANIQLNQWVGTDPFRMADFNEDNQKLDEAITALQSIAVRVATGSYTGNGALERKIALDFTPKAVLVCDSRGRVSHYVGNSYEYYGGLAIAGYPCCTPHSTNNAVLRVADGGFYVYFHSTYKIMTNQDGLEMHYIAFG